MEHGTRIKLVLIALSIISLSIICGVFLVVISELTDPEPTIIINSYVKEHLNNYQYRVVLVSDDDSQSKNSTMYLSTYTEVLLSITKSSDAGSLHEKQSYTLRGYLGNGDHGMQLSDLVEFNDNLVTICDVTGILSPWLILTIPSQKKHCADAPFHGEWITIKDDKLLVGMNFPDDNNYGSEYMHVKAISKSGEVVDLNWDEKYKKLKEGAGVMDSGFIRVHGCFWSSITHQWVFALYAMDTASAFNASNDQLTNTIIIADESLSEIKKLQIGSSNRGFTAVRPVPLSNDKIFIASKVEEYGDHFKTYLTVFQSDGTVIMQDCEISDEHKFEGIAFLKFE